MPETLSVAVCISDEVTLSDFIPPIEILSGINDADHPIFGAAMGEVPYRATFEYLSPTLEPVVSLKGRAAPTINPTMTYADAITSGKQFDILWVPAGQNRIPKEEIQFIAMQAPKAKYILSVCGGAVQLAFAGVLSGKRATTNKAFYRAITAATPKDIQWVPKARWVVDGNIWTSSGVAAGSDMALAFVEHLVGAKAARQIRGTVEIPEVTQQDDPFATFHGLV
ncbi:class I glutamine amidotransferase-like protein [Mycena sp. CBHHK59/15]|nr:class I glutamine amidotransferase-like protein [Mycena sp. CBHHK59/15]KAJ6622995.1 class I glutamine amidotransferase-like protein [Mycena sp. CBHHK59/15]